MNMGLDGELRPTGYALLRILEDCSEFPCDYELVEVNETFVELFGLEEPAFIGKRMTDLVSGLLQGHDLFVAVGKAILSATENEFIKTLVQGDFDYILRSFPGKKGYRIALINGGEPVSAQEGAKSGYWCERYFDITPYGVFLVDGNGQFLDANTAVCQITGYTDAELRQMNILDLLFAEDIERSTEYANMIINTGGGFTPETRYCTKAGDVRWVAINTRKIEEDRYLGFCQDNTEKRGLENELIQKEKRYEKYINASKSLILLKDDQFRYVLTNQKTAEFYCQDLESLIGKTDFDFLPRAVAEECRRSDLEVLRKNETLVFYEAMGDSKYEAVKFPVPIGDDKIGVGAYIRDITQEKQREERIRNFAERNRIIAECLLQNFENTQDQLSYALQEALKLTKSQYGYIFLYDESKKEFTSHVWTSKVLENCVVQDQKTEYKLEKTGIWGDVVRHRKPLIINEFDQPNPGKRGFPEGHIPLKRFMSIPMFVDNKIVAVVGFGNKDSDYDDADVYEMIMLMNGVWLAVENKNSHLKAEALAHQMESMFNGHEAVMLLLEPETGKIRNCNLAATEYYGYSKDELIRMSIQDINTLDNEEIERLLMKALRERQKYFTFPHRLKNGEIRMVDVYSCPINFDGDTLLYSIIFDVTEREKAYDEIRHISDHDYLTGLYNRRFFECELMRLEKGKELPFAIIVGDVNGLKTANDIFGYQVGDRILRSVAKILKKSSLPSYTVARIGGDEFGVILPNSGDNEAIEMIERIKVAEQKHLSDQYQVSISLGFQTKFDLNKKLEEVLTEAEDYMFRRKMMQVHSIRNQSVLLVMNALFAKSKREMEHSRRVSIIAEKMAIALDLERNVLDEIKLAGLLHDIGKIGIPERILNKPGRLLSEEYDIIKTHAEIGWRILASSQEFKGIAEIVLHHHERWDGKGYMNGLKGEEIPIQSRILAVADTYDAITADRPYREALNDEDAIKELLRCAGSQFDPRVVETFVQLLEEDSQTAPRIDTYAVEEGEF